MIIGEINLAGARLLGYRREAITGKNIANFIEPESNRRPVDLLKSALSDGVVEAATLQLLQRRLELLRPLRFNFSSGGKLKTVRTAVGADPTGRGIVIALVDLT